MNELISVVIPVYNVEKFVKTCLVSVLNQSYKHLDIILVDDGSTDSSGMICDAYAKEFVEKIRVIHQDNQGLSGARNAGIKIAKGKFITFVDSDDFMEENMIEHLYQKCIEYDADISICACKRCNKNDTLETVNLIQTENSEYEYSGIEKMGCYLNGKIISPTAWGKLYKTSLFEEIFYPIGKYHEDIFTTYKLIDKAKK